MKKNKKILKIFIVVFLILIIILLVLKKFVKKQEDNAPEEAYYYEAGQMEYDYNKLTFKEYYQVKNCLQMFVNTINIDSSSYYERNDEGEYVKAVSDEEIKKIITNLLDYNYLKKNGISIDNLYDYISVYQENKIVIPTDVIAKNEGNAQVKQYGVEATVISTNNKSLQEKIYVVINIDYLNNTFSIELFDSKSELNKYDFAKQKGNIEKNDNNIFYPEVINSQKIAEEYFFNFKNFILSDKKFVYEKLNEEYKEKRFSTYEKFEDYCNKTNKIIEKSRLVEYQTINNDDQTQYVCIDQYDNTYIFNEKDVMNYDIILDLYTIELPEFVEKYDNATAQEKVMLNIEKVKQALNYTDYDYAYSKLDSNFKNNNYPTVEEFKEYITADLYDSIKINYKEFNNEGTLYIYDVEIQNLEENNSQVINMQIVMKLLDNRDFVMSFNIK